MERSKTAKSSDLLPLMAPPSRRSLRLQMKPNPSLYRTDSRFLNSPVEEEEEGDVGFRPLRVIGQPIDKGSVDETQGQRLRASETEEDLSQERIIEFHAVGPEAQGIQTTVEALFLIERIGVAPNVRAGFVPKHHTITYNIYSNTPFYAANN